MARVPSNDEEDLQRDLYRILYAAQIIRINQRQMQDELPKWPKDALNRCDDAWATINEIIQSYCEMKDR